MRLPTVLETIGLFLLTAALGCRAENEGAIKEFGVSKSKPINTSFFFWNYEYVEAPYLVERRGLDIFINGILIQQGPQWPQKDWTVKGDPGDPPADWRLWGDKTGLSGRKWGYLSEKYELDQARRLMVEFYRKCSDVEDANCAAGSSYVWIRSKDGKEEKRILSSSWKSPVYSKEEVLNHACLAAKSYEGELQAQGALLWVGDRTPEVYMGALQVLEAMLSDLPADERIKRLDEQKLLIIPEMRKLVTECPRNEQLVKRYALLKNGELRKDPPEPQAWLAEAQEKSRRVAAQAVQAAPAKAEQGPPKLKIEQKEPLAETKMPVEQNRLQAKVPPGGAQQGKPSKDNAVTYAWSAGGFAFVGLVFLLLGWRLRRK